MLAQFDGTPMLLVGMGDGSLLYYQISEHCMCMVHAQYCTTDTLTVVQFMVI